jgi:hypothetical protein
VDKDNIVLFSSYAKLPSGTASGELFRVMALVMLVDVSSGKIVNADCTLSTRTSENFITRALVGGSLAQGPDKLVRLVNDIYQGSAKRAIITALKGIYDKYEAYIINQAKIKELNA